jgi:8-oxo-dGTP diphosphatase
VELIAHEVLEFHGEPAAHHAQALRWEFPRDLLGFAMPGADRPIAIALLLPRAYAITPEPGTDRDAFLAALECTLTGGARMIQLRAKTLARGELRTLAAAVLAAARRHGAIALLNGDAELAAILEFDGVHLPAHALERISTRPMPREYLVAASCHDGAQLARALELGVDFVTLSPVLPTASHPGESPLGWERFAGLCAGTDLPVFALGGLEPTMQEAAIAIGAHGAAGISHFWHDRPMHAHPSAGEDASA